MKHTPGPWRFARDGREPYWNVDMPMQDGSTGYGFANAMVYTTVADARLIAAAPELLTAIKQGLHQMEHSTGQQDLRALFRSVINKAEGRGE